MMTTWNKLKKDRVFTILLLGELLMVLLLLVKASAGKPSLQTFHGDVFFDNVRELETVSEDGDELVIEGMPSKQQADLEHGINIYSGKFALSSGGYLMSVDYESDGGETIQYLLGANGYLGLRSRLKDGSAVFEPLYLDDAHSHVTGRLYIPVFSSVDDLQLFIHYDGPGKLRIRSITLEERTIFRFMQVLGFLCCFLIFDIIYYFIFSPLYMDSKTDVIHDEGRRVIFISVITVLFASLPLFTGYVYEGHDILFHLNRIEAIASAMRYHRLPVRIQSDLLLGFGYSIPLYYCDIFLYPSAFLYEYCLLPLRSCYQAYIAVMNILTAYLSYRCFRTIFKDSELAVIGMAMYTLSAYRLIDIYLRAAVGEYTALTFIPLVLEGAFRIYSSARVKINDWLPLAIGMSGLIQSHIVTTVIVGFFLFLFFIVMIKKLTLRRLGAFAMAAFSSLLFSLWFLLPMIESMKTQKPVVTDISNRIQWTGIYLSQLFELFPGGDGISREGTFGDMPLGLGAGLAAALVMLTVYALIRNVDVNRDRYSLNNRILVISFGLGMLALWMSTVYFPRDLISRILIGRADSLRSVWEVMELVWRHMVIAVILIITAFIALLVEIKGRRISLYRPVIITIAALTVITGLSFYQGLTTDRGQGTYIQMDNDKQAYLDMSADYDLVWGMTRAITDTSVITEGSGLTVNSYTTDGADRLMNVKNSGDNAEAVVPLFDFGNYHACDIRTGKELAVRRSDINARLAVNIPEGFSGDVRIRYIPPLRWHVAEAVSLISWLITAGYALYLIRGRKRAADE